MINEHKRSSTIELGASKTKDLLLSINILVEDGSQHNLRLYLEEAGGYAFNDLWSQVWCQSRGARWNNREWHGILDGLGSLPGALLVLGTSELISSPLAAPEKLHLQGFN
jgi:hypothetical protein